MDKFDNLTVLSDVRESDGKERPWQDKRTFFENGRGFSRSRIRKRQRGCVLVVMY